LQWPDLWGDSKNLLQDTGRAPKQVIVDLGYRGVDADNPSVQIIHRGKYKSQVADRPRESSAEAAPGHRAADRPHEG